MNLLRWINNLNRNKQVLAASTESRRLLAVVWFEDHFFLITSPARLRSMDAV